MITTVLVNSGDVKVSSTTLEFSSVTLLTSERH